MIKTLSSVDVYLLLDEHETAVVCTPQEAFTMMSMPAFAGMVTKLVPNYELSEVSEEEN